MWCGCGLFLQSTSYRNGLDVHIPGKRNCNLDYTFYHVIDYIYFFVIRLLYSDVIHYYPTLHTQEWLVRWQLLLRSGARCAASEISMHRSAVRRAAVSAGCPRPASSGLRPAGDSWSRRGARVTWRECQDPSIPHVNYEIRAESFMRSVNFICIIHIDWRSLRLQTNTDQSGLWTSSRNKN